MKVLYVNHTSLVSGAERSLLELIELTRGRAEVILACPPGELLERARARGIATVPLDLPPLGFVSSLPSAVLGIGRAGRLVRRLVRHHDVDVVHASSPRAGLLTTGSILSGARRVVDVRDVLPAGARAACVRRALRLTADLIVFNSQFTHERFGPTGPAKASVLHPPVHVDRLLELPLPSAERRGAPPVLGVLGQITPWKGQDDAIRILAAIRERFPGARLRIVGSVVFTGSSVTFDNEAFGRRLRELAAELDVADAVDLAGETEDLEAAFASLDVLLVPSWQEPFGRVVVEGMAAGVPVIATSVGGPSELIEDGVNGFLAPPHDPEAWVDPVSRLLESVELARRIAESARERASTAGGGADTAARLRTLYGLEPAALPDSTAHEQTAPVSVEASRQRS
jgi:glycosyltransferase involved in cell wall biosynthesis